MASPYEHLWSLPMRTLDPDLDELRTLLDGPDAPTWVVMWVPASAWGGLGEPLEPVLDERYRPHGQGCGDKPVSCAPDVSRPPLDLNCVPTGIFARAALTPAQARSGLSSCTGTRTVSTSAAIRIRPRRPAASTIGSTAWLSARVVSTISEAPRRVRGRAASTSSRVPIPRRCQAGSTRSVTGRTPGSPVSGRTAATPTGWSSTSAVTVSPSTR